jgi:four helix bundle protein
MPLHSTLSFQNRCIAFGAAVFRLSEQLPKRAATRTIADQLVRSGMSVGANACEARSAESRADFIHKMQVALKEARETAYWLGIIDESGLAEGPAVGVLRRECHELTAILVASVHTAKNNLERRNT